MTVDLRKNFVTYAKSLNAACEDTNIQTALTRAVSAYRNTVADTLELFPHTPELAKEVREIKNQSMANLDELLKQAMASVERNKGKAFYAKDHQAALEMALGIIGNNKTVVKGKSMLGAVSYTHLRAHETRHDLV